MKRLGILVIFMLTTIQLLAQTQYDYYEGEDAYGGVDTAISGLKILGIIILVILVIVIVGIIWAKTMDVFKSSKEKEPMDKPLGADDKTQDTTQNMEDDAKLVEPIRDIVITIDGKTVEADVTMEDGSKKMEWFWYEIGTITYNFIQDITHSTGDDIVKPAGSVWRGLCVKKEDVNLQTIEKFKKHNELRIRGEFNPKKLQMLRVEGLGLYDTFMYYYDGEGVKQSIIPDKEAEVIANSKFPSIH